MKTISNEPKTDRRRGLCAYRSLSLVQLASRIVEGDREALDELHACRRPFRQGAGPPLRFIQYATYLRTTALDHLFFGAADETVEEATNLLIDKFSNLPSENGPELKQCAVDCRNYYRAFMKQAAQRIEKDKVTSPLEQEKVAATILQRFVNRHFCLSLREAFRRSNPLVNRYEWKIDGHKAISVWLPRSLPGSQRKAWLEGNIDAPDLSRIGEKQRIQSEINRLLLTPRIQSLDGSGWAPHKRTDAPELTPGYGLDSISTKGLAGVVAEEKAAMIHRQRPGIRKMGPQQLKAMILYIFEQLERGDYTDSDVARYFGVSKATYSRFAGQRWRERSENRGNDDAEVPDLWRNVGQTVSLHAGFCEAAQEAGVWKRIETVLSTRNGETKGASSCTS